MIRKVKAYIVKHKMITVGDCIIVGVSGGPDSMCLLDMLLKISDSYKLRIYVIHVNHQIRSEAEEDRQFVENYCREREIPFREVCKDVIAYGKEHHLSEEEAGREIRYCAFEEVCEELSKEHRCKIAVGHNQNDRAETMIFHLARGTGLTGLRSILPCRGKVIRPLLCITREEVEEHLEKYNIGYRIDKSNLTDDYTRNQIRHHLIPNMKEINQRAVEHMNQTADKLEQVEAYFMKQVDEIQSVCVTKENNKFSINLLVFKNYDSLLQEYVIREILYEACGRRKDFTSKHICAVLELQEKTVGKYVMLPYGIIGKRGYNAISIDQISSLEEEKVIFQELVVREIPSVFSLPKNQKVSIRKCVGNEKLIIEEKKYTKCFDYDKIENSLSIRSPKKGDYIALNTIDSRKSLRRYMIEYKIPKGERNEMLVIVDGNHVVWVVGGRISECYKVTSATKQILEVTIWEDT